MRVSKKSHVLLWTRHLSRDVFWMWHDVSPGTTVVLPHPQLTSHLHQQYHTFTRDSYFISSLPPDAFWSLANTTTTIWPDIAHISSLQFRIHPTETI